MNDRKTMRMLLCAPLAMLVLSGIASGQFVSGNEGSGLYGQEFRSHESPYGYERQLAAMNSYEGKQVSYNYASPETSCSSCSENSCSGSHSSCDMCFSNDCPLDDCERCPTWFAGTEFTFLALNTSSSSQTRAVVANGADLLDVRGNGTLDDFTYAPRIWMGRQFGHWGVVARYWYLADSDGQNTPLTPPFTNTGSSNFQTVRMETLDLEAVRSGCINAWKFDGFAGVRYATFNNGSTTSAVGIFNGGTDLATAAATSGTGFSGTGLTFALQGRRPLGCTNLHLFARGRGSVLWGSSNVYSHTEVGASAIGASGLEASGAFADGNANMWIAEVQVGLQWEYELSCLPAVAFFRSAFEYQYWDIQGDGFANSNALAVANATSAFAEAQSGASSAQLYGVSVGTGLTW